MVSNRNALTFNIVGNSAGFRRELRRARGDVSRFGATVREVGRGAALALGGLATVFAARGVGSLIGGIGEGIRQASDFEESLSKIRAILGDASGSVESFAANAVESMGATRAEALAAAGDFANLFTGLGLGRDEAARSSTQFLQLAADLSSFNNVELPDVLTAIRAGLVGEAEPLRRFGILLNAAKVEAKAQELGLVDLNGQISEQAKVQARAAIIIEQTTVAQGDFARTADDAANRVRVLEARQRELSEQMGRELLPLTVDLKEAQTALVGGIVSELVPALRDLREWFQDNRDEIERLVSGALTDLQDAFRGARFAILDFYGAVREGEEPAIATLFAIGGAAAVALGPLYILSAALGLAAFQFSRIRGQTEDSAEAFDVFFRNLGAGVVNLARTVSANIDLLLLYFFRLLGSLNDRLAEVEVPLSIPGLKIAGVQVIPDINTTIRPFSALGGGRAAVYQGQIDELRAGAANIRRDAYAQFGLDEDGRPLSGRASRGTGRSEQGATLEEQLVLLGIGNIGEQVAGAIRELIPSSSTAASGDRALSNAERDLLRAREAGLSPEERAVRAAARAVTEAREGGNPELVAIRRELFEIAQQEKVDADQRAADRLAEDDRRERERADRDDMREREGDERDERREREAREAGLQRLRDEALRVQDRLFGTSPEAIAIREATEALREARARGDTEEVALREFILNSAQVALELRRGQEAAAAREEEERAAARQAAEEEEAAARQAAEEERAAARQAAERERLGRELDRQLFADIERFGASSALALAQGRLEFAQGAGDASAQELSIREQIVAIATTAADSRR